MKRLAPAMFAAVLILWLASTGHAQNTQNPRTGRLLITVIDQTNAIIPGATVTVTGLEPATEKVTPPAVQTTPDGLATIPNLPFGRYTARAEFEGFHPGVLKEARVRAADNRHIIVLLIENFQEAVNVAQDAQSGAADRRGDAFGSVLTREQMDALSDDPNEMQRQLQDMAGPGAVIRIDSFEGGTLPPKAMIKSIRVTRDQFAAENHSADSIFIEVITQPGVGPIRTNMNYNLRAGAMSARNAFTPTKGDDQNQNFGFNFGGGLIPNVASFSIGMYGNASFDTPNISVANQNTTLVQTSRLRMPREFVNISARLDYALTRDQTLRLSFNRNDNRNRNLGIGGFNLGDRAYSNRNQVNTFRIQEVGPLGRRFFMNTRLNVGWTDFSNKSATETPTVRVIDHITFGGAQVAGGRHSRDVNLAGDLDYVRGLHSLRAGTQIDANWFHSDDTSNYLGTYTFETPEAFDAGTPRSFTKRVGNPNIEYSNVQSAFYLQDDIRVRRGLTITPGVRYEWQSIVGGSGNLAPRLGATWAPFRDGKTTIRASWGVFHDWLGTQTYEQTLRVDGYKQRELDIKNPSYPDPSGDISILTTANRYQLAEDVENPRYARVSTGVDYAFTPRIRANAIYRYSRGTALFRGLNLNSPVDGVRPNPEFGNIVEVVSDATGRQHSLQIGGNTTPPQQPAATAPRWDWKRYAFYGQYTWSRNFNNTDGPFATPAMGDLTDEWGVAPGTATHRFYGGFFTGIYRNLALQVFVNASSATPYTIQTGYDDNGDLIYNDRPAGVGRNTARAAGQWQVGLFSAYTFTFGPRLQLPPGVMFSGGAGGITVTTVTPPEQGRYRMTVNVNVENLTNHTNFIGYSGAKTSPFFGQPTQAMAARRISVGFGLGF